MKIFKLKLRMTIITLLIVTELFSQSIGTKVQITTSTYQKAECSIAIDPTNSNNLLACTMTLTGDNKTKVGTFYSTNGGTTWSGNDILISEYDVDPSVAYDANGNAWNNVFTVGDFGLVSHFNGSTWKHYNVNLPMANFYSVSIKENMVTAVGQNGDKAVILIGKRKK